MMDSEFRRSVGCRLLTLSTMMILNLLGSPVHAQGAAIPGTLVRPANSACLRDDVKPQAGRPTTVLPRSEVDLRCAVTPMQALEWLDSQDVVFVDTRSASDFSTFGLRGAINLKAEDIPSKSFLKSKRVVLFGSGKGDQELYRACSRLKGDGFARVHVVRGGMMLWHLTQQPVLGRPPQAHDLARLDPGEFWREGQFDDNVVMLAPGLNDIEPHVSFAVQLPEASADAVKAVLERRNRELKGALMNAVVLATGRNVTIEQWEKVQQALWPTPVLHYAEGALPLNALSAKQRATWEAMARGPKKPVCGT